MKKDEIHLDDIGRILFGSAPPMFLVEVFLRALITYVFLLLIVKWLGKRMSGQLTIMEMAVMLTLGAIVSVPMQTPDRGILQGLILLLCAVGFQRGISYLGYRSHRIENITQGKPTLIVKNGTLQFENMRNDRISRQQLFSELRREGIFNLGMVDRVYLEACGLMSIYKQAHFGPGLPLYPPDDLPDETGEQLSANKADGWQACTNCGNIKLATDLNRCSNCKQNSFTHAIL